MQNTKQQILGVWVLDPKGDNKKIIEAFGNIAMQFQDDGKLSYWIQGDESKQYVFLDYEIRGNEIVTNQPTAPREETTQFQFDKDKLILNYNGMQGHFVRKSTLE